MPSTLFDILSALPTFALVLFRLSGLMLTAPLFSSRVVPIPVRAGLTIILAAMIFPLVHRQAPADLTLATAIVGGVGEIMIGAIIGLSVSLIIETGAVAGLIVGRQASIGLATVFDPSRNDQSSIIGQIYTLTLTAMFLMVGGHRATVAAVLDTYQVIPLLSFTMNESLIVMLAEMLTAAFTLGLRLAGPVLIALFLMGSALAFLSRTMPQLNILTVGFSMRVMVGLGVSALAMYGSADLLLDAVWDGLATVRSGFGLDPSRLHLVN